MSCVWTLNSSRMSWCWLLPTQSQNTLLHNCLFFCEITLTSVVQICVHIYIALVLVDLHGMLHLWQCFHVAVAGLPFLTVILLLIELLQMDGEKGEKGGKKDRGGMKEKEKEAVKDRKKVAWWTVGHLMSNSAWCWITSENTLVLCLKIIQTTSNCEKERCTARRSNE